MAETVFNGSKNFVSTGNFGIGTTNPATTLQVQGGVITNSDAVSNKRYSYTGSIAATASSTPLTLTFGAYTFYAKVVAVVRGGGNSNNVNTMVLEVQGGNQFGSTSSVNIALGTNNIFGGANAFPWTPTVTTTVTTVVITPTPASGGTLIYDIFVELISGAGGTLTSISQAGSAVKTFTY